MGHDERSGGQPGTEIGSFDARVRYNATGNRDHLEFTIVDIAGETYMKVFSVRDTAQLALIIWGCD